MFKIFTYKKIKCDENGDIMKRSMNKQQSSLQTKQVFTNEDVATSSADRQTQRNDSQDNPNGSTPSLQSLSIGEIIETPDTGNLSISAVLHYCKCKILRPYLRLLAVMGLRPLSIDRPDSRGCIEIIGYLYTLQMILLMVLGYVLQYMACFRRDRGFCYKLIPLFGFEDHKTYQQICYGSIGFSYILPSLFHLCAYIYALYLFRVSNNEQLQSLMERVFLLSSSPSDRTLGQHKLVRTLWIFVALSIFWMFLSLATVNFMMAEGRIMFQWISDSSELLLAMKILLTFCTFLHDMVLATIITSYCLQAQLLTSNLYFLKAKLMQQFMSPLDWMREISEFRKLLKYLNDELAPSVCFFTIINMTWAMSGIVWLLDLDKVDKETIPIVGISILNVSLWAIASLAPFVQAARLTSACTMMQGVGHDVRTRPFAYQATPGSDLDSILLYASSLRLSAKLFRVPITGRYLCLSITAGTVIIMMLGQCHFIRTSN